MLKSILVSAFILFCAAIIESSILSNITFFLVVPDLVLICTIYFSLLNGKAVGEITGFVSGIFIDFISGFPMGFNCLYRTAICYVAGLFSNAIIISGIFIPMISAGAATIAKTLFVKLISIMFPSAGVFVYGIISSQFLFELIENIVLAPFLFKFLGFFKSSLAITTTRDKVDNV